MPVFNNVRILGVVGEEDRGWQAMPALLRNCPRLETITVQGLIHDVTDKCGDVCPCISREDRGASLKSCPVNRIEIHNFQGTMKEMAMIKHFLDFFPCLKRFDVFVEDDEPTQLRNTELFNCVVEMFKSYKKLSPSCNLRLLWTILGVATNHFVTIDTTQTSDFKMNMRVRRFELFPLDLFATILLATAVSDQLIASARDSKPASDLRGAVAVRRSRQEAIPSRSLLDHTATVRRRHRSTAQSHHHH
ncbi:unnamed protein product [Microthlaspi erraticum]|uniref:FBD domain-containing protein n=1 Tax=Microthlaspi erraticum TaxID=1685480 RepID=A0A6D2IGT0_9BRAS|nr:unnamed protein product [Microthlaspi erraticum]